MNCRGWAVPQESNGGIPVNIQDQTSKSLDLDFIQAQGAPTTLAVETAVDDTTIELTSSAGFVDGNIVGLFTATGSFYFGTQIGAPAANVITLDTPLDQVFPAGTTNIIRASNDMTVTGTLGAPQIFQIGPIGAAIEIDIVRVNGYIQAATAMDLSDFGDLAALTNGIVFRRSNGSNENKWNAKTNGRLKLLCGVDLDFTSRAPAGSDGMNFRMTYAGTDKHGVALRLEANETLELLIQDDLSGLQLFNMMAQGHVVTD